MKASEVSEQLSELGLTETESTLYLAGLAAESTSVQELAKATGIKRPTIYHALATLTDKGLVALRKKETKTRFSMSSPDHLLELVRERREKLLSQEQELTDSVIPLLKGIAHNSPSAQTSALHYEGIAGVKAVIDAAIYCKSKKWDIIAPIDNVLRSLGPSYTKHYLASRTYHGITSRTLWERYAESQRLSDAAIKERNPRILPASMEGTFKSMLILFDDKIAIISSEKEPSAVLITSAETHALMSSMFEAIWNISEPY